MNVTRWRFEEVATGETHTVEINPNEAASHRATKNLTFTRNTRGRNTTMMAPPEPAAWSFGGIVRTQSHHDALVAWSLKKGKVRVTDHLGRTFEVMMQGLDIRDRRPTQDNTWRFEYTVNALLLRRIA